MENTNDKNVASRATDTALPARRMPAGRTGVRAPQPDRRLAILLAAEKLFALNGYHAVSIRDIAAEAGVPLALVGYYYGAKHELYKAIFESWQDSIDRRLAGLRDATADPAPPDALERIVDAFVSPVIAMQRSQEGQYFALMAARERAAPSPEGEQLEREFFDPMANAFIDALTTACPGASRAQTAWCYQFALGAMLQFLLSSKRGQRLSKGEIRATDAAAKDLLLRFIAAGFRGALASAGKAQPKKPSRRKSR